MQQVLVPLSLRRLGRSSDSRVTRAPSLPVLFGQWHSSASVSGYSGGSVPDLHGIPSWRRDEQARPAEPKHPFLYTTCRRGMCKGGAEDPMRSLDCFPDWWYWSPACRDGARSLGNPVEYRSSPRYCHCIRFRRETTVRVSEDANGKVPEKAKAEVRISSRNRGIPLR